jgi:hypothetical protein
MTTTIKTVIFVGSSKTQVAPWGGDARLGDRVLKYVQAFLESRTGKLGDAIQLKHEVTTFDPIEVFAEGGVILMLCDTSICLVKALCFMKALAASGAEIRAPHFFFKPGEAPAEMDAMRDAIKAADCYLIVTPEYNHSLPPALTGMMGNFGGSNYAGKCSGVVTYSPSPWG